MQTRALRNDVYVSFPLGMTILDLHLNERKYTKVYIIVCLFCVLYHVALNSYHILLHYWRNRTDPFVLDLSAFIFNPVYWGK